MILDQRYPAAVRQIRTTKRRASAKNTVQFLDLLAAIYSSRDLLVAIFREGDWQQGFVVAVLAETLVSGPQHASTATKEVHHDAATKSVRLHAVLFARCIPRISIVRKGLLHHSKRGHQQSQLPLHTSMKRDKGTRQRAIQVRGR